MEVEVQKRNTDCVYFLASPLTCKKGSECEYRHSENARLNPRDCWYWLNSNCLNPTCAFRHPPLEGITETASESVCIPPYAAVPTSKSNVPCYFYFNAYCIKGDQCPFLHDTMPSQKFPKTTSGAITHALEIKTSTESDTGPALVEFAVNASGDNWEMIKHYHSKEVLQQPVPSTALQEPSSSVQSSVPECEEPAIKSSEMPDCPAEYTNGSPHLSPGQDSEELVKECVEQDDWWESSPGFDVLVDDGSEKIAYEDDAEYLLAQERESGMTHNHLLQYDFEVPAGYDPAGYPDAGYLYDHGVYDSYDPLDTRYTPEHFQRVSERSRSRERNSEPDSHRRRKPPRRRHEMNGRDSADLRERLRKRRRTDVSEGSRDSRRHHSSRTRGSVHERTGRWGMGPSPHSRHAPEVGQSMILSSLSETQPVLKDFYQQTWVGYPQSSRLARSRLKEREIRRKHKKPMPTLSSQISLVIESSESKTAGAAFTGPKTLAQIKEEKRRAKENGSNSNAHVPRHERPGGHAPQHERRPSSIDFEGPKPLNELLKDKRRPVPLSGSANGSADMASKQEHLELSSSWVEKRSIHPGEDSEHYHETVKGCDNEFESDFVGEEDDDDDDALRRKLAHILSQ